MPGALSPELRGRCVAVEALLAVDDAELHRGHFSHRARHAPGRALPGALRRRSARCRTTSWLGRARRVSTVIDNDSVDVTLARLMALVLDAVREVA